MSSSAKALSSRLLLHLAAGFGATLVAVLALIGFSVWGSRRALEITHRIYEHPLEVSNAALAAESRVLSIHRALKDLALFGVEARPDLVGEVDREEQRVLECLDLIDERILGEEGEQLAATARSSMTAWRPIRAEVLTLLRRGDRAAAAEVTAGLEARHVFRLLDQLGAVARYARARATEFHLEAEQVAFRWLVVDGATLIIGLLGIGVLNWRLAKGAWVLVRALERSEQTQRSYLENAPYGVVVADRSGVIREANHAFGAMLGLAAGELVGTPLRELTGSTAPEDPGQRLGQSLAERTSLAFEAVVRRRGGDEATLSFAAAPLEDGLVAFAVDLTERKAMEERLRQSQKMQALGTLASGVAHEMNNVLAAVIGLGAMLEQAIDDGSPEATDLQQLMGAARRGRRVVENLLGVARGGRGVRTRFCPNELVRSLAEVLGSAVGKGVTVKQHLEDGVAEVVGDWELLSQVLLNLSLNARDAIGDRGTIVLATTSSPEEPRTVTFTVRDEGCGMDEHVLARAGEPFFTTKAAGQGTGLGLWMAHGVANDHGGEVVIESAPGRGTTARVIVPAAPPQVARPVEGPHEAAEPLPAHETRDRGVTTVLVVDDEESVCRACARLLQGSGYAVLRAYSGAQALEMFRGAADTIDIVLLDLAMPEMDGRECFEQLKAIRPDVRVILCSGHADLAEVTNFRELGVAHFLPKPFERSELLAAVDDATPEA